MKAENSLAVIACRSCGQKLRLPASTDQVRLRCGSCQSEFSYPPEPLADKASFRRRSISAGIDCLLCLLIAVGCRYLVFHLVEPAVLGSATEQDLQHWLQVLRPTDFNPGIAGYEIPPANLEAAYRTNRILEVIFVVCVLLLFWLYHARFEASSRMATPGKLLVGAIVTDREGKRISISRASARFLLKLLLIGIWILPLFAVAALLPAQLPDWCVKGLMILTFIPLAFIRLTRKTGPLHDALSRTVVQSKERPNFSYELGRLLGYVLLTLYRSTIGTKVGRTVTACFVMGSLIYWGQSVYYRAITIQEQSTTAWNSINHMLDSRFGKIPALAQVYEKTRPPLNPIEADNPLNVSMYRTEWQTPPAWRPSIMALSYDDWKSSGSAKGQIRSANLIESNLAGFLAHLQNDAVMSTNPLLAEFRENLADTDPAHWERVSLYKAAGNEYNALVTSPPSKLFLSRLGFEAAEPYFDPTAARKQRMLTAIAIPNSIKARNCINNLKAINGAKNIWARENKKDDADVPTDGDLFGPDKHIAEKPMCPAGGTYDLKAVGEKPTCTVPEHAL